MKIGLYGKYNKNQSNFLKKLGFEVVKTKPEIVFVFGGDGSLMLAENMYPSIPKVAVRRSRICKKCLSFDFEEIAQRIKEKKFKINNYYKIDAIFGKKIITGINDIVLHNDDPRHAVRYSVKINEIEFYGEIIGDGIVVSSVFGASGYFRSITDSVFYVGMGIAFNNSTEATDHLIVSENDTVEVVIKRGPARVYADNTEKTIKLSDGDKILIKKSNRVFRLAEMHGKK